jgi:hypothetical protein
MNPRQIRNYSDCLYFVQAVANCVYPYAPPAEMWRRGIFDAAGIPYTDEPTLSQLYAINAFLLDELKKMHEQTEGIGQGETSKMDA